MRAGLVVTASNAARILHLDGYGIAPGNRADFVLLQASDPVEAIRLRATRLRVWRRGRCIAESPPAVASLHLDGRPASTAFMAARAAPAGRSA